MEKSKLKVMALAMLIVVFSAEGAFAQNIAGVYKTDYGEMRLQISGSQSSYSGKSSSTTTGNLLVNGDGSTEGRAFRKPL